MNNITVQCSQAHVDELIAHIVARLSADATQSNLPGGTVHGLGKKALKAA